MHEHTTPFFTNARTYHAFLHECLTHTQGLEGRANDRGKCRKRRRVANTSAHEPHERNLNIQHHINPMYGGSDAIFRIKTVIPTISPKYLPATGVLIDQQGAVRANDKKKQPKEKCGDQLRHSNNIQPKKHIAANVPPVEVAWGATTLFTTHFVYTWHRTVQLEQTRHAHSVFRVGSWHLWSWLKEYNSSPGGAPTCPPRRLGSQP